MANNTVETIVSLFSAFLNVISLVLVFIGWKIIHSDTRKIATRNETFELIKDFVLQVESLKKEGIDLWLSDGDDKKRAHQNAKINSEIQSIRKTIKKLSKTRGIPLNNSDLIEIRRALTLNYKPIPNENELNQALSKIFHVSGELKWKAYTYFEETHKPFH